MNNAQLIHQDSGNPEWYTPPAIVEAARRTMGRIDLDPASCAQANQVVRARRFYTSSEDGLSLPWFGNVWMNHPYGRDNNRRWPSKIMAEYASGVIRQACFIVWASTSEQWFKTSYAYPICFIEGRVQFTPGSGQHESGAGKGSAVIYLGPYVDRFAASYAALGSIMIPYQINAIAGTLCPVCERRFTSQRRDSLYCGAGCRQKAKRQKAKSVLIAQ